MLPLHLQSESHVPLYIQLRDQLRALVHAGDLRNGDRIPASRELANMLGVHRTTVANAYAELESEGLDSGTRRARYIYQKRQWQWIENLAARLRRFSTAATVFAGSCCSPMNAAKKRLAD